MMKKINDVAINREGRESSLFAALLALKSADECRLFLDDLCTPTEMEALSDRWLVAQMLEAGRTQRDIAAETGVSIATVSRVARFLHGKNKGYKTILDRLK